MIKALLFIEKVFTCVSLFFFSHGLFSLILGDSPDSGADKDSPLLRLIFLFIYFVSFSLLSLRWRKTLRFFYGTKSHWVTLLLALALLSVFWSSIPSITFRKGIGLIGSTIFGLYLASTYTFDQQLKIMGWTFGLSAILSLIFVAILPEYGVMNTDAIVGAWQGIYPHKNGLGEAMFISFLSFLFLAKRANNKLGRKLFFSLACFISFLIIYFSESSTALISAVLMYGLVFNLKWLSIKSKLSVFFVILSSILIFIIFLILVINLSSFLDANNKDITLSGRIPLWASLWEFMKMKFWFGYGYGAFFSASHEETLLLWKFHTWQPVHAHNGFIQLWMHLGSIGFIIFLGSYLYTMVRSLFNYLIFKDVRLLWCFCFTLYTIFFNFTEVSFFSMNKLNWVLALVSIYSIDFIIEQKKSLKEEKHSIDLLR